MTRSDDHVTSYRSASSPLSVISTMRSTSVLSASCAANSDSMISPMIDGSVQVFSMSTVSVLRSMSGRLRMFLIWILPTGSSHTVCQIPLTGVYQMPLGFVTCFPRDWNPLSVGSRTRTTIVFLPLVFTAAVISKKNGVNPPLWVPTLMLFTHTSACQSTAPKCSIMFWFFHCDGILKSRLYHKALSFPSRFSTPDSCDSTANGTRIVPSNSVGRGCADSVIAYSQCPFRFDHLSRSIIGRGYSCQVLPLVNTFSPQVVTRLFFASAETGETRQMTR